MGFSNAIYKYPKYKDTTLNQIFNIENYYNYDSNEWAKKNFSSAIEYMNYNDGCNITNYVAPTEEQLDFYKQFLHKDEFDRVVIHDYVYDNCSGGIPFHEDVDEVVGLSKEGTTELTKDDILKLFLYEVKKFNSYKLEPAYVNNCFTYKEEESEDEADILLKKCDGIEITFKDDFTSRRVETNSKYSEWGTLLMLPRDYIDEWAYYTQHNLIQTLANILETTNFEKEYLIYNGGW